jgi:hypothetical protein
MQSLREVLLGQPDSTSIDTAREQTVSSMPHADDTYTGRDAVCPPKNALFVFV